MNHTNSGPVAIFTTFGIISHSREYHMILKKFSDEQINFIMKDTTAYLGELIALGIFNVYCFALLCFNHQGYPYYWRHIYPRSYQ